MSAPTPPSRPQYTPTAAPTDPMPGTAADARTVWIAPTPPGRHVPAASSRERLVLPARSPVGTAFDLVARLGTAITLAALLVVTASVVGVGKEPVPTHAATTGR